MRVRQFVVQLGLIQYLRVCVTLAICQVYRYVILPQNQAKGEIPENGDEAHTIRKHR